MTVAFLIPAICCISFYISGGRLKYLRKQRRARNPLFYTRFSGVRNAENKIRGSKHGKEPFWAGHMRLPNQANTKAHVLFLVVSGQ